MAIAETAKLAVEIGLTDKVSPGIRKMEGRISGLGNVARRTGKAIGIGLAAGLAAGTAIVVANVRSGIDSLVVLESAVTSVDGAIAQLGLTGKVTGAQVAAWANEIEGATQAAFDDKDITAATANLIRYGKVGPANLRDTMVVMTDLAARTGDVGVAGELLGKSLANPAKASGKLSRYGIYLTKTQQKLIDKMTKAGDIAGAQAILLDALATSTTGAAAAMNGPMKDAQETLKDVTEDAQRALAKGFLPVLMRVQKGLAKALGDPKTLAAIESFGQGLAGAFDNVVAFAEKVDWGKIGSGLKVAADWGGKFIGAIAQMPPEVLGAIIALGGLNKLSGGAVSGMVGELGKGLIKGVLGINAGVVNLRAGAIAGGGGGVVPAGGKSVGGKVGGALGAIGKVFLVGMAAAVAVELAGALGEQSTAIQEQGAGLVTSTKTNAPGMTEAEIVAALAAVRAPTKDPLSTIALLVTNPLNKGFDNLLATEKVLQGELAIIRANTATTSANTGSGAERALAQAQQLAGVKAAALESARAIRAKKWDVDVKVNVPVTVRTSVSVRDHNIAVQTNRRYQNSAKVGNIRP